jgi:hypothetical protein
VVGLPAAVVSPDGHGDRCRALSCNKEIQKMKSFILDADLASVLKPVHQLMALLASADLAVIATPDRYLRAIIPAKKES